MVQPEPIDTFRNREQVDAERSTEGRGIDGRMGGVPYGHVARRVNARQIERCHQAGTDHRRRHDERDRLNPAMPNDERRPGREVEHRERNDRSGQRTRDPREDRQHAPERQRGFRAEQRTSAPDRAQDQRQDAEESRQVVTPEDQQHERAADEDDRLQQPPEMDPGPPVDPRRPGTPAIEMDDPISSGVVHGPGHWTPYAEAVPCPPQIELTRQARSRR